MNFTSQAAGETYSLVCAVVWAVAIILFRKSGESFPPVALNLFKNIVALALFLVTLPILGVPLFPADVTTADWLILALSGVLGLGVADSLFFASLNRIGAGNTAIVDSLYSPFIVLIAWLGLGEHIGLPIAGAVALMVVAILVGTWEPGSKAPKRGTVGGIAMGVVAILLMAAGLVMMKPVLSHANAWWVTTVRLVAGTLFIAVQAALPKYHAQVARCLRPGPHWKVALPAAVVGTYIAMIIWILGLKYTLASRAGVLNQMSSIFVILLAAVFLKEKITARRGAAVVLAIGGAVLATR